MNDTSNNNPDILINITKKLIKNADFLIKGFQDINEDINKNNVFVGKSLKDQEQKGINKLITELKSEKKYLTKLLQNPEKIQSANIYCSNISYYSAVYQVAISEKNITAIYEPVTYFNSETNTKETIRIDVISNNGLYWIKVKVGNLSNKDSKSQSKLDNTNIVEKETQHLINLLKKVKNASKQNLIHYRRPKVILKTVTYPSDINKENDLDFQKKLIELETTMEQLNIKNPFYDNLEYILSPKEKLENKSNKKIHNILKENFLFSDSLFLDVTALIAIISDLSNLPCQSIPSESLKPIKPLYQQYLDESSKDVPSFMSLLFSLLFVESDKNKIDNNNNFVHHRELVTCITAVERLWKIVKIIAGPRELLRTIHLFSDTELSRMKEIKQDMIITFNQKFNQDNKYDINNESDNYYNYIMEGNNEIKIDSLLINCDNYYGLPKWLPKVKVINDQPSELFLSLMISSKMEQKNKKQNNKNKNHSKEINDNKRKKDLQEEIDLKQLSSKNKHDHQEKKLKTQENNEKLISDKINQKSIYSNNNVNINDNGTINNVNDNIKNDEEFNYENWFEILDSTEIIFGTAEALHMTLITSNDKKVKTIITEWKKKNEQILREIVQNNNLSKNQNNQSSNTIPGINARKLFLSEKIKNNIHNYNFSYWIHPPRSLIEERVFSK